MKKKARPRNKVPKRPGTSRPTQTNRASHPVISQSLSLLSEISQEITCILDRDELFRRIAERVKKVVDYHLFSVMLWNEKVT